MAERKKLELDLNRIQTLELLFDEPVLGKSSYGNYFLYAVRNGSDTEMSFFAPEDVHEKIKMLRRGDRFEIVKLAEQKGNKIITSYDVKVLGKETPNTSDPIIQTSDNYYALMLNSCKDAIKIQNELGGMFDAKSLAVTLFIARSKINSNGLLKELS